MFADLFFLPIKIDLVVVINHLLREMLFILLKDLQLDMVLQKDVVLRRAAMVDDRLDNTFDGIGKIFHLFFRDEDFFGPDANQNVARG